MIMIEIQYSGTALLLPVNPCILHQNDGTCTPQLYQFLSEKKMPCCQLCSTHYTSSSMNQQITSAIKVAPLVEAITCLPQNQHFSQRAKMNKKIPLSNFFLNSVAFSVEMFLFNLKA